MINGLLLIVWATTPPRVQLIDHRGPGTERCPSTETIELAVTARLGYSPFRLPAERTMRVAFSRDSQGMHANVDELGSTAAARGSRQLHSATFDCQELSQAVALALSIAIDPSAGLLGPSLEPPAPPAPAASTPPSVPTAAAVRQPAPPVNGATGSLAGPRAELWVAAGAAIGTNPSPVATFALGAAARWPFASLGLEATANTPTSSPLPEGTFRTFTAAATATGCGHWRFLGACALATAGGFAAWGETDANPMRASAPLIEVGARLMAELPITQLVALRARLDGRAALATLTVTSGGDEVWRQPRFSGAATLAAVVRLP